MTLKTTILVYILFITITILIIPFIVFKLSNKKEISFKKWLEYIGLSISELVFIFISLVLILFFNNINMIFGLVIALYIIVLFNFFTQKKELIVDTDKKKKFGLGFIIVFIPYISLLLYYSQNYLVNNDNSLLSNTIYLLPLNLLVLLIYFVGIRFKDFKWNLSIKTLLLMLVLYFVLKPITLMIFDIEKLQSLSLSYFLLNFIHNIYYPAFIEEILFRGLLLQGLVIYGLSNKKAVIIQAIIFGLIHVISKEQINIISILSTSMQIYIGYLFGKLYIHTKSLTPNILLHALFNVI